MNSLQDDVRREEDDSGDQDEDAAAATVARGEAEGGHQQRAKVGKSGWR